MRSSVGAALAAAAILSGGALGSPQGVRNDHFELTFGPSGVVSLKPSALSGERELLSPGVALGDIVLRYRMLGMEWRDLATAEMADARTIQQGGGGGQRVVVYNGSGWYDYFADLEITTRLRLEGDALFWTLHLRNVTHKPVEIGIFYLPLPLAGDRSLKRDVVLAGHSSYVSWGLADGDGPRLVMTLLAKCPLFEPAQTERNFAAATLEAADEGGVYIHAGLLSSAPGGGPKPGTRCLLTPKFTPGDEITYGFKFRWVEGREALAGGTASHRPAGSILQ